MAIDKNADFTPSIPDSEVVPTKLPYNQRGGFKFWAQKVIPLVYNDSLSYYEVLCKVVNYLNNVIQNVDNLNESVNSTNQSFETLKEYVNTTKDTLINTYNELQDYVNTYFDNLDVQEEINAKLDAMADSGELTNLLAPFIPDLVAQWLNTHVTPTSPIIDNTLSISGAGADAKVTGDKFTNVREEFNNVNAALSDDTDLLSESLSDKSATSNGVTYTLSGSTVTINGTATRLSAFTVLGSTSSAPPSWLKRGKSYIVNLENTTPAEIHFQAKTTTEADLYDVAIFKESGRYIFTVPENITVFRILLTVERDEFADGTLKAEIFNTEIEDIKNDYFELTTDNCPMIPDNSDIDTYTTAGTYKITNNAHAATMTNLPESTPGKLIVIATAQASRLTQVYYTVGGSAPVFIRTYDANGWGDWTSLVTSDNFEPEIEDIKNDYFELTTDNCPMIPDNSDIDTYTTAGTYKITNNAHATTMTNLPEPAPGKLIVIATTQASRLTQMYYTVGGSAPVFIRTYDANGWGDWTSLVTSNRSVTPIQIGGYSTGSGDTAEKLSIYVPAKSGYIRYEMRHFVSEENNCNGWQVYHAYHINNMYSNEVDLTISGEWECALHLEGRDDFSGGHTHGDEIMESITCLVDGIPTTISGLTTRRNAKEVRIIETSILYDPADHTTQIAEHGKEYVFTKDGLTIEQSVKWLVSASLTNCFMAMFLPSKNYTDRATANSDFKVLELASSTSERQATIVKQKANAINMWDTGSGFSANISTPIYPTGLTGGDQISIGDNNGNHYNKLYFKVCGGGSSSVGELWKSKSVYKLDFSD